MIRTLIVAILAAGIASIAWMGVSRWVGQFSISAVWVSGLYVRKEAAARRTRDPKIVLVGGSATHYGFSARELQLLTGSPAVNLGTHGGLGMEYLLYRARRSIRPGDIAVLAIEPPLYSQVGVTEVLAEQVMADDLAFLLRTSPETLAGVLFALDGRYVAKMIANGLLPWRPHPIRQPENVSAWGDESLSVSKFTDPYFVLAKNPRPMSIGPLPADVPAPLAAFLAWAKENGVTVAQAWPPLLSDRIYERHDYDVYFRRVTNWYTSMGALSLGGPLQFMLSREDMFESIYHANDRGRTKATAVLAWRLCAAIRCPAMPADPGR